MARNSSNWGRKMVGPIPHSPSEFELKVKALKLNTIQEQILSRELKNWADKNKNSCYVPERLLKCWGFIVNDEYL